MPSRALALLFFLSSAAFAQTVRRVDSSTLPFAEATAFARKTLTEAHVTGAQLAILNRGKLVWTLNFGTRRLPGLPFESTTTTWAASITKAVFATYVMQLVERGQFNLDTPIATQLPKPLDQYEPYRLTAADLIQDPAWPLVTPRMLLSHSAGLLNFALFEDDKKMHLHFKPGTQFSYSGDGINLLQFVIEQRLGKPLDQLMQQAIFTPLNMTRTSLVYQPRFEADIADRFDLNENFLSKSRRDNARAAGSMTTSAEDLARFLEALLASHILKPATRTAMLSPVLPIRTEHQFPYLPNAPFSKEAADAGLAYGIGWGLLTTTRFGPAFFKEGHGDGAQNYLICFTRHNDCMILLTNSDNGEFAFRPLFEHLLGDTVTPWEWESYTPASIAESRKHQ